MPKPRPTAKRLSELEEKNAKLLAENKRLKKELAQLKRRFAQAEKTSVVHDTYDEFIEAEGVLWKRAFDGQVEHLVYCLACRLVMLPVPTGNPTAMVCTHCKRKAPFEPGQVNEIIARIGDEQR